MTTPEGLDDTQVDAYLARLGLPRPERADVTALAALQRAHLGAVPFENLSVHLGEPIVLEPGALFEKIVTGGRGGFCYELNGLFAELLRALGYRVTLLAGRVFQGERMGPPFDHMALRVDLDEPWLADVGFGNFGHLPLRLDVRDEQKDPAGIFTVTPYAAGPDGPAGPERDADLVVTMNGEPQYRLDRRPYRLADFAPTCWWQATSPASHFRRGTTCSRLTADGGRTTLAGTRLIRTGADGEKATRQLTEDEALTLYREEFGIALERLPVVAAAR